MASVALVRLLKPSKAAGGAPRTSSIIKPLIDAWTNPVNDLAPNVSFLVRLCTRPPVSSSPVGPRAQMRAL